MRTLLATSWCVMLRGGGTYAAMHSYGMQFPMKRFISTLVFRGSTLNSSLNVAVGEFEFGILGYLVYLEDENYVRALTISPPVCRDTTFIVVVFFVVIIIVVVDTVTVAVVGRSSSVGLRPKTHMGTPRRSGEILKNDWTS